MPPGLNNEAKGQRLFPRNRVYHLQSLNIRVWTMIIKHLVIWRSFVLAFWQECKDKQHTYQQYISYQQQTQINIYLCNDFTYHSFVKSLQFHFITCLHKIQICLFSFLMLYLVNYTLLTFFLYFQRLLVWTLYIQSHKKFVVAKVFKFSLTKRTF